MMQVIETTLPLTMDVIKRFYEQKESTFFEIDYQNSSIQGEALINYIGNLEIDCNLKLEGCSQEDVETLLVMYLKSPLIISCPTLACEVIDLLFCAKGIQFNVSKKSLLDDDQKDAFIAKHANLIGAWVLFIDSLWVFATLSVEMAETGKPFSECLTKTMYPIIRDREVVGRSVVKLFEAPSFFEAWFSVRPYRMAYFEYQFEERFTGNRMLYDFFANEKNWLLLMVLHESDKQGFLSKKPPVEEAE